MIAFDCFIEHLILREGMRKKYIFKTNKNSLHSQQEKLYDTFSPNYSTFSLKRYYL